MHNFWYLGALSSNTSLQKAQTVIFTKRYKAK